MFMFTLLSHSSTSITQFLLFIFRKNVFGLAKNAFIQDGAA